MRQLARTPHEAVDRLELARDSVDPSGRAVDVPQGLAAVADHDAHAVTGDAHHKAEALEDRAKAEKALREWAGSDPAKLAQLLDKIRSKVALEDAARAVHDAFNDALLTAMMYLRLKGGWRPPTQS